MALVLAFSTSCKMTHNMGMPMNDMNNMDNSQSDAMDLIDPVCGMQVDVDNTFTLSYEGTAYYFDSEECLKVFQKNPEKFLKKDMKTGKEKSKKQMNGAVMMGGAAMVAMMVVMITLMLVGGGH